jgi:hypothetical protein
MTHFHFSVLLKNVLKPERKAFQILYKTMKEDRKTKREKYIGSRGFYGLKS